MFPTHATLQPASSNNAAMRAVVVVLPLEPVTAITRCPSVRAYRLANSISLMSSPPAALTRSTSGAVSGIPGLLMTGSPASAAPIIRASSCPLASHSTPAASNSAARSADTAPASLTQGCKPWRTASRAAPVPLSPAPSMGTMGWDIGYRTFRVTMVTTANRMPTIQNRAVILDSGMFCFW